MHLFTRVATKEHNQKTHRTIAYNRMLPTNCMKFGVSNTFQRLAKTLLSKIPLIATSLRVTCATIQWKDNKITHALATCLCDPFSPELFKPSAWRTKNLNDNGTCAWPSRHFLGGAKTLVVTFPVHVYPSLLFSVVWQTLPREEALGNNDHSIWFASLELCLHCARTRWGQQRLLEGDLASHHAIKSMAINLAVPTKVWKLRFLPSPSVSK